MRTPEKDDERLPSADLWLADGYNLLHCAPFRAPAESATSGGSGQRFWSSEMRERLVEVARRFAHPHRALWIVFDGPRENTTRVDEAAHGKDEAVEHERELHVCFAPSADDWIVRRVKQITNPAQFDSAAVDRQLHSVAVVSGDRKLGNRARHHGAAVVSPRLFLAHCGESDEESDREPG